MAVKFKQLSQEEFYRLCVWMTDESDSLSDLTYEDAARKATEDLGQRIIGAQIKRASNATGVMLSPRPRTDHRPDLSEVKGFIGMLAANQRVLSKLIEPQCPGRFKSELEGLQVNIGRILRDLKEL